MVKFCTSVAIYTASKLHLHPFETRLTKCK